MRAALEKAPLSLAAKTHHSAATPARVQFEVIENSEVAESATSADDWSFHQSHIEGDSNYPDSDCLWFKPGVFYFRRAIRRDPLKARAIGLDIIRRELKKLEEWAVEEHQIKLPAGSRAATAALEAALEAATSYRDAMNISLMVCAHLERTQSHITLVACLIPQRWIADPDEAAEKGWTEVAS